VAPAAQDDLPAPDF